MSDDFDTRLLDLIYGELTPEDTQALEAELSQDAAAQQTVQAWRRVRDAVQDLPVPEPDPQVHYSILRAAREAVEPAKPKGFWAWLSGVALNPAFAGVAVMALAVGSVVFFQLNDDAPESALDKAANGPAPTATITPDAPNDATKLARAPVSDAPNEGARPGKAADGERGEDADKQRDDAWRGATEREESKKPAFAYGEAAAPAKPPAIDDDGAKADRDGDSRAGLNADRAKDPPRPRARKTSKKKKVRQRGPATRNRAATGEGVRLGQEDSLATKGRVASEKTAAPKKKPAPKARRSRVVPPPKPVVRTARGGGATDKEAARSNFAPPPPSASRSGARAPATLAADVDAMEEAATGDSNATKDRRSEAKARELRAKAPANAAEPAAVESEDVEAAPVRLAVKAKRAEEPKLDDSRDARPAAEAEIIGGIGRTAGNARGMADEAVAEPPAAPPVEADGLDAKADADDIAQRAQVAAKAPAAKATVAPKVVLPEPRRAMAFDSGRAFPMDDSVSGGDAAPEPVSVTAAPGGERRSDSTVRGGASLRLDSGGAVAPPARPQAAPAQDARDQAEQSKGAPAYTAPPALSEARAARARGDHRAAVGAYARYFQRNPGDGQFSRGLFEAAASYEALGQVRQAIRMYGLVPPSAGPLYAQAQRRIEALDPPRAAPPADRPADSAGADRVEPKPVPPSINPPR